MKDHLTYITRMAERARLEPVPDVHAATAVMAGLRSEVRQNDRVLAWMAAASAALAAGVSAYSLTILRALSDPLATLFQMSATLIP